MLARLKSFAKIFAAAAAVAACAHASASESADGLRLPGMRVSCDAAYQLECGADGCAKMDGLDIAIHVAFSYDGDAGTGSFCMATGCEDVVLINPLSGPDEGVFAAVMSRAADGAGASYRGVVALTQDGSAFQFVQGGTTIWGGACSRADAS